MDSTDLEALRQIQRKMSNKLRIIDDFEVLNLFCGCDVSYQDDDAFIAFVTLNQDFNVVEERYFKSKANFPYITSFFAFREGPLIINSFSKLHHKPDILFIDGHGIAHPERMGLASYIGVKLNFPTIGIAKKNLSASLSKYPSKLNEKSELFNEDQQKVGYVIKTAKESKAIYISPGNLISIDSAVNVVLKMLHGHKLPEPSRQAHLLSHQVLKMAKQTL